MLRRLIVDSVLYTLATAIPGLFGLALLPVYTRFLHTSDYGLIDLIGLTSSIVTTIATLEVSQGLARHLPEALGPEDRRKLSSTAFWFTGVTMLVATGLLALAAPRLAPFLLQKTNSAGLLRLGCAAALMSALQAVALRHLRGSLRPKPYLLATIATVAVTTLVTLLLLTRYQLGPAALFLGYGAGATAGLAVGWRLARAEIGWTWDVIAMRRMLKFSLPMVASTLGIIAAGPAGRWIIAHSDSLDAAGLLGIATRVASVIGLAASGLQQSLGPLIYTSHRQERTPANLAMSFSLFAACGLTLCAGLSLFSPEIVHVIAAPRFHGAAALIGPVSAAMLIMATTMFAPGLEIECKTSWIAGTGLTSGAVNLLLCWLWVPRFGAMGAASAMCCSATLQMLVIFSLSQRNYRVPHRWGRLVAATLLTALVTRSGPGAMIVGLDLDHWAARGALLGGLAVACWLLLVQPFVQTSIRSHFLHGNSAH